MNFLRILQMNVLLGNYFASSFAKLLDLVTKQNLLELTDDFFVLLVGGSEGPHYFVEDMQ